MFVFYETVGCIVNYGDGRCRFLWILTLCLLSCMDMVRSRRFTVLPYSVCNMRFIFKCAVFMFWYGWYIFLFILYIWVWKYYLNITIIYVWWFVNICSCYYGKCVRVLNGLWIFQLKYLIWGIYLEEFQFILSKFCLHLFKEFDWMIMIPERRKSVFMMVCWV